MLESVRNNNVSPLTWKSKTILKPTQSVKDAESRALCLNAENSPHFSRMVERLLFGKATGKLPVKCFTDNRPLLQTVVSTKSPLNKDMKSVVRYLKDKLRWGEVSSYSWLPTQRMISDGLMKEMKMKGDVWDIFRHNYWKDGQSNINLVTMSGLEFKITNPTTKDDEE